MAILDSNCCSIVTPCCRGYVLLLEESGWWKGTSWWYDRVFIVRQGLEREGKGGFGGVKEAVCERLKAVNDEAFDKTGKKVKEREEEIEK